MVFAAAKLKPEAHPPLFVLAVLAIVPLAALLSYVAAKMGDAAGGLLNATLGNLTAGGSSGKQMAWV